MHCVVLMMVSLILSVPVYCMVVIRSSVFFAPMLASPIPVAMLNVAAPAAIVLSWLFMFFLLTFSVKE